MKKNKNYLLKNGQIDNLKSFPTQHYFYKYCMWNFIKKCFEEYNETQLQLSKMGIYSVPHWHGLMYYVMPETEDINDKHKPIPKDRG